VATPTGELAAVARELAPVFASRADEAVALRRLPEAQWKELVDAGLMYALAPRSAGGGEVCAVDFVDAVYEVARAEPNTGWVYGVCGVHPYQLASFDPRAQDEMWGAGLVNNSSSFNPTGKAEPVEGGYRVSGRWSFSTGCDHCEWVMLGALVGTVELDGHRARDLRSLLLPRSDYRIDPVWNTVGMAGTGSHDIVVEDAFVPEHRSQSHWAYRRSDPLPGWERNPAAVYKLPFAIMFGAAIVAAVFGAAAGFLDAWTAIARDRIGGAGAGRDADNPFQRRRLAEARYDVDSGFSRLRLNLAELEAMVEAGPGAPLPDALRARARFEATLGAQRAVKAADELYSAASGRIVFPDHPLHRRYQDVKAGLSHAYLSADGPALAYGAALMGRPVLDIGI
jgi:3-hydroxy-9,10-secoandrosta-1,3,5(10)-triene-9,17-dione monooxygenase